MIEYIMIMGESTIKTLISNILSWVEFILNIIRDLFPGLRIGMNINGFFVDFWFLLIFAVIVLFLVLQVRS